MRHCPVTTLQQLHACPGRCRAGKDGRPRLRCLRPSVPGAGLSQMINIS